MCRFTQGQRQQQAKDGRHQRPHENIAQSHAAGQQRRGYKWPEDGTAVVHRPVQAKGQAALRGRHAGREQRIARRRAQSLADAVGKTDGEQRRPTGDEGNQRSHEAGQRIAENDPRFGPPRAIDNHPGKQLEQAGRCLGYAFDQAQGARPGHQHRGQVDRDQRVKHVAGRVVDQADQADEPDGAGEGAEGGEHGVGSIASDRGVWCCRLRLPPLWLYLVAPADKAGDERQQGQQAAGKGDDASGQAEGFAFMQWVEPIHQRVAAAV